MAELAKLNDPQAMGAARRAFIKASGLAAAGVAALGVLPGREAEAAVDDAAIFNFALNLEYLEAEFYLHAAFGHGLDMGDTTGAGGPPGGVLLPPGNTRVTFSNAIFRGYAEEIAGDEQQHVRFIRSVLGGGAVARPKIDLNASFTAAARAAGVIGAGQTFNPFHDEDSFLIGAFIFEDVGVTAYKGAARLIANPDYLEAAAGILAVEAYHAGEIRTLLIGKGLTDAPNKISAARGALSGNPATDQGVTVKGKVNVVPALPASGIVPSRTTSQVLNIVYLGGTANDFGFFPNKLNGAIK